MTIFQASARESLFSGPMAVVIFALFIVLILALVVMTDRFNRMRIRQYFRKRGGNVVSIELDFSARHRRGEMNYEIQYVNSQTFLHRASVRTSLWGVRVCNDERDLRPPPR